MIPDFLVTHSGGFHADELLSSVVLTRLFPQARLVRSRAAEWITPATDRIIYDVGGAYDPEAGIFDHHQRGAPLRDDGQPFSSFGLIWKHFGIAGSIEDFLSHHSGDSVIAMAIRGASDKYRRHNQRPHRPYHAYGCLKHPCVAPLFEGFL